MDYNINTAIPDMDDQMFELLTGVIYRRPLTDSASSTPPMHHQTKKVDNRRVQPEVSFDDSDRRGDLDKSTRPLMKANHHRAPMSIEPELIQNPESGIAQSKPQETSLEGGITH